MHAALPAAASRPREIAGYLVTRYQRHVSWCLCDHGAVAGALDNQRNAGHDAPRVAPTIFGKRNSGGRIRRVGVAHHRFIFAQTWGRLCRRRQRPSATASVCHPLPATASGSVPNVRFWQLSGRQDERNRSRPLWDERARSSKR
jgi:hypothetical protein